MFFDMQKCVYSESVFDTSRQNTIPFGQNEPWKIPSFSFRESQLITVAICDPYISRSTRFVSLKLCVGYSIFDSISFLLKFIFLFNKMYRLFVFKRHNSFQIKIIEKPKVVARSFKIQWYLLELGFPKNSPGDKVFNPENRSFENVSMVTLK